MSQSIRITYLRKRRSGTITAKDTLTEESGHKTGSWVPTQRVGSRSKSCWFFRRQYHFLTRSSFQVSQTTTFVGAQEGFSKYTRTPPNISPHIPALFVTTSQIRCHTYRPTILFIVLMDGPPRFTHTRPLRRSLVRSALGREWSRGRLGERARSPCEMGVPKV